MKTVLTKGEAVKIVDGEARIALLKAEGWTEAQQPTDDIAQTRRRAKAAKPEME